MKTPGPLVILGVQKLPPPRALFQQMGRESSASGDVTDSPTWQSLLRMREQRHREGEFLS